MLSVVLRRSSLAAQKVWQWAGPPQRCFTSLLTGAHKDGSSSMQTCWASKARPLFSHHDDKRGKCPAVLSFRRTELLHGAQSMTASYFTRSQLFHSSAVRLKKRPLPKPEPPPRELDLLRYDMKDLWKGPKPALYLGFAGLIPFAAPTLIMAMSNSFFPELAYAQVAYAAAIISFLGGARWGFALPESSPAKPDWINLANSVVPSLLAWVTMMFSDNILNAGTMAIMALGIALHYDLSLLPTYPTWFKALRAVLTIVAFFSLLGTLVIFRTFPAKKIFSD